MEDYPLVTEEVEFKLVRRWDDLLHVAFGVANQQHRGEHREVLVLRFERVIADFIEIDDKRHGAPSLPPPRRTVSGLQARNKPMRVRTLPISYDPAVSRVTGHQQSSNFLGKFGGAARI